MPFLREHPAQLAQFRAGVMAAFDAVYHAYRDMLDRLLRVAFKIKDANKRADILHDTFIRVWKPEVRLAYDGVRDFGPYISKIAGNRKRNSHSHWCRRGEQLTSTDHSRCGDRSADHAPTANAITRSGTHD